MLPGLVSLHSKSLANVPPVSVPPEPVQRQVGVRAAGRQLQEVGVEPQTVDRPQPLSQQTLMVPDLIEHGSGQAVQRHLLAHSPG